MPHDQADELRALALQAARTSGGAGPAPRFWAVSSGKGGVGTTTVAVNLATALGLAGHRVVLVDADVNRADVAEFCGLAAGPGIADLLAGRRGIHELLRRGPGGIQVVPGPWADRDLADAAGAGQQRLLNELTGLGAHAELVILDVGAGLNRVVRRFWQHAERIIAVTSTEPVPLMDTYAAIKVLLGEGSEALVHGLVNLAPDPETAAQVFDRLARACRRFLGVHLLTAPWLPRDPSFASAARAGVPLVLDSAGSPTARAIETLAEQLWHHEHRPSTPSPASQEPASQALLVPPHPHWGAARESVAKETAQATRELSRSGRSG